MGKATWDGVPLCEDYQRNFKGRVVSLEAQVDLAFAPRIIGELLDDGPYNDDIDTEAPIINEEYDGSSAMADESTAPPFVPKSVDETDSIVEQKKFIPPASLSGRSLDVKKVQPLYVFLYMRMQLCMLQ